jgi:NAD(P)-dependent dehydrogenase (short-subunit alcohol dehydrogenase family)
MPYAATKAGIISFAKSLSKQGIKKGICVNTATVRRITRDEGGLDLDLLERRVREVVTQEEER